MRELRKIDEGGGREEEGWISRILQIFRNGREEIRFILKYIFVTRHELKSFKIKLSAVFYGLSYKVTMKLTPLATRIDEQNN